MSVVSTCFVWAWHDKMQNEARRRKADRFIPIKKQKVLISGPENVGYEKAIGGKKVRGLLTVREGSAF
jgi:hypothetical protein